MLILFWKSATPKNFTYSIHLSQFFGFWSGIPDFVLLCTVRFTKIKITLNYEHFYSIEDNKAATAQLQTIAKEDRIVSASSKKDGINVFEARAGSNHADANAASHSLHFTDINNKTPLTCNVVSMVTPILLMQAMNYRPHSCCIQNIRAVKCRFLFL